MKFARTPSQRLDENVKWLRGCQVGAEAKIGSVFHFIQSSSELQSRVLSRRCRERELSTGRHGPLFFLALTLASVEFYSRFLCTVRCGITTTAATCWHWRDLNKWRRTSTTRQDNYASEVIGGGAFVSSRDHSRRLFEFRKQKRVFAGVRI